MLFSSIWIIIASMLLSIWEEVIIFYHVTRLLSYIQFIDWFFTCLDLYFFSSELKRMVCYLLFYKKWSLSMFLKCSIFYNYFFDWLIFYLLSFVYRVFFYSLYFFLYLLATCFCLFVKWSITCIEFIDWLFPKLNLSLGSFLLNYYSQYVFGCFTINVFLVCLWNDY